MANLAAAQPRSDRDEAELHQEAAEAADAGVEAARMVARARWLLIISGFTTLIAIAAVLAVIGYRVFRAGGSGAAATTEGIVTLPKAARVVATAVAGERIVVTLDVAGATEIRIFDAKTLQETGRIRFATEP
jgi:anti-sigma factor RsiW